MVRRVRMRGRRWLEEGALLCWLPSIVPVDIGACSGTATGSSWGVEARESARMATHRPPSKSGLDGSVSAHEGPSGAGGGGSALLAAFNRAC